MASLLRAGVGGDLMEIAGFLLFITLVSMLVRNSRNTSELIKTTAESFGGLMRTATGADFFN